MAVHTRYLISPQGNRNLVLDRADGVWADDAHAADVHAVKLAKENRSTYYVHEITVRAVRQHAHVSHVSSTDMAN